MGRPARGSHLFLALYLLLGPAHTLDSPPNDPPCLCAGPVALLISGQSARFCYQASLARAPAGSLPALFAPPGSACRPQVHVYVALSHLPSPSYHTGATAASGRLEAAPLHAGLEPRALSERVCDFYRAQGASACRAAVLGEADMDAANRTAAEAVSRLGAALALTTPARWWRAVSTARNFASKQLRNGRMLYLRHVAFRLALGAAEAPRLFVYAREDAAFFGAPDLRAFAAAACAPGSPPAVAVDGGACAFGGHPPDKAYAANRAGAAVLFGDTLEAHHRALHAWLARALLPEGSPVHLRTPPKGQPLMTEAFLHAALDRAGAVVRKVGMRRVDLRAMRPAGEGRGQEVVYCVPSRYWACLGHRPPGFQSCDEAQGAVRRALSDRARRRAAEVASKGLALGANATGRFQRVVD